MGKLSSGLLRISLSWFLRSYPWLISMQWGMRPNAMSWLDFYLHVITGMNKTSLITEGLMGRITSRKTSGPTACQHRPRGLKYINTDWVTPVGEANESGSSWREIKDFKKIMKGKESVTLMEKTLAFTEAPQRWRAILNKLGSWIKLGCCRNNMRGTLDWGSVFVTPFISIWVGRRKRHAKIISHSPPLCFSPVATLSEMLLGAWSQYPGVQRPE